MQRDRLLLAEIIEAAERIVELTVERTALDFDEDRDRRDALLWNFTVLGEGSRGNPRPPSRATGCTSADLRVPRDHGLEARARSAAVRWLPRGKRDSQHRAPLTGQVPAHRWGRSGPLTRRSETPWS